VMFESPLWIIAKQQSDDAAGESHDAGLGREVAMRCFVLGSGVDHQEPRHRREEKLGEQLLLDAVDGLGVQLTQGESVALEQLVELLDLPTQVIDLLQRKRPTATQAAHGSRARDRQVADMRRIDVGPRPAGRDALAAWYAEALDVQRASGLSVAEFAPRVGVSAPTFYAWRRRLDAATPRELPAQLVELTVARGSSPAAATGPMVVQLCAGRRSIEVPAGFDGAELQRLVAAIESC